MRNADVDLRDPLLLAEFAGGSTQRDFRPPSHLVTDFNVAPLNAARPAGAQGLQYRLFSGEAAGVVLRRGLAGRAVFDFVRRKDARQKKLAVALNHFGD